MLSSGTRGPANESDIKFLRPPNRVARWHILKPKISIWVNFGGLAIGDVGIFYDHLVYFTAVWYILWSFGIFYGYLVHLSLIWFVVPKTIWQPCIPSVMHTVTLNLPGGGR
jgi:hypothetical protein